MPKVGEVYNGVVIKIMKAGALVKLSTDEVGFVHISELSLDYVKAVEHVLHKGQEIKVRVLKVNYKDKKISLSISKVDDEIYKKSTEEIHKKKFETDLERFLKDSADKIKQLQKNHDRKQGSRKRFNK